MNFRRLGSIIVKELRHLARDHLTFGMIIGIPILELVLFGYAINMDVRNLDAAVLDQANTARSRELIADMSSTQVINLRYHLANPQQIDTLLREGRISVALVVPPDFEARLERRDGPALQIIIDGSDQVVQAAARQLAAYPVYGRAGWTQQIAPVELVNFYNPQRRAPVNSVPGLIGMILTMTMTLFTAMALVRERERGNMEMLIATPVSAWELTLGKVLPFVGIGIIQVALVLAVGDLLFDVPNRGSTFQLYLASMVFIIASLALGMFISTLAQSQFQAMQMGFFTFLPQILLSGFVFPYAGMPRFVQWLAEFLPLTHFLRLVRGIMLRNATLADLWQPMAALGGFIVVLLVISVARVHKRLD